MADILQTIAEKTKERIALDKEKISDEEMKAKAESLPKGDFCFEKTLKKTGVRYICECKKASPSKGVISPDFDCLKTAAEYEKAGADCLSVLTEPFWFLGNDEYIPQIKKSVSLPVLRKDFTVDPYMIYQAKVLGADAVLLICAILETDQIKEMIGICDELGLSALVEAHDEAEIQKALQAEARIIGVNNRNLRDFSVNINNAASLRKAAGNDVIFVAESGIQNRSDIETLEKAGTDAVLIGETLMRAEDKKAKLNDLKGILC